MPRCRKISTDISVEAKLNRVSLLAALLYSWGIPHARDDCRLPKKDPEELRLMMIPGRPLSAIDVAAALAELVDAQLMGIDEEQNYFFPAEIFYKYQTYINIKNRQDTPPLNVQKTARNSRNNLFPHMGGDGEAKKLNEITPSAENSKKQQETARNSISPSHSPSLSRGAACGVPSSRARETIAMVHDLGLGEDVFKVKEILAQLVIPLAQRKAMPARDIEERKALLRRQAAQLRGGP
jgi:hypothetical protein